MKIKWNKDLIREISCICHYIIGAIAVLTGHVLIMFFCLGMLTIFELEKIKEAIYNNQTEELKRKADELRYKYKVKGN